MTKIGLFIALAIMLALAGSLTYAGEKYVTSEKLSIEDVVFAIKNNQQNMDALDLNKPIQVLGIHQTGNTADVYFNCYWHPKYKDKRLHLGSASLVRFNSGKWFFLKGARFLKR
jgi:hypothetical protein